MAGQKMVDIKSQILWRYSTVGCNLVEAGYILVQLNVHVQLWILQNISIPCGSELEDILEAGCNMVYRCQVEDSIDKKKTYNEVNCSANVY